jgi:uncharacterized protein
LSLYKASLYNFIFKKGKGYLVFNTLSKTIAYLSKEVVKALQEGDFESLETEVIRELEENNLIVPNEVDELAVVKTLFWRSKFTGNTLGVTVLPTYDCNMACPYCYEGDSRPSTNMSKALSLKVCDWIINQLEGGKYTALSISFYGGEPLLRPDIIFLISETLKAKCNEMAINFSLDIITNGVLLSEDIINELKEFNWHSVQITLDGPPNVHDKRRVLKNGEGSFCIIIDNIKKLLALAPDTRLNIRINIDKGNAQHIDQLLNILENEGISQKALIGVSRIFLTDSNKNYYSKNALPDKIVDRIQLDFLEKCRQENLFHSLVPIGAGPTYCGAASAHSWVIAPDGKLYKCLEFIEGDQFCMGSILEGINIYRHLQWLSIDPFESKKCRECLFLPCCGGGCVARAYYETRDISERVCPWSKLLFRAMIEHRVEVFHKNRLPTNAGDSN